MLLGGAESRWFGPTTVTPPQAHKKIMNHQALAYRLLPLLLSLSACSADGPPQFGGLRVAPSEPVNAAVIVDELAVMPSLAFPQQANVVLRGHLRSACDYLSEISNERSGDTILLRLDTLRQDGDCTQVGATFEEIVPLSLEGLEAGSYTLKANGSEEKLELLVDSRR